MPKFVPVTDTERPQSEQVDDDSFAAHRHFDNPHSIHSTDEKGRTDRGWKQGEVGWGVVKSFGAHDRDDAAQVAKHAEGANKMIRNEKGLWVKAKTVEIDESLVLGGGRGRSGVSVVDKLLGGSHKEENLDRDNHKKSDRHHDRDDDRRFKDRDDTYRKRDSRDRSQKTGRDRHSESRDRKGRRDRDRRSSPSSSSSSSRSRSRSRGRDRNRSRRSYSRSRSPRRKSYRRDRSESEDRKYSSKRRNDSRDRDRERDRNRDKKDRDRDYDRKRTRDNSRDGRKRDNSSDAKKSEKTKRDDSRSRNQSRYRTQHENKTIQKEEIDKEETVTGDDETPLHITAIQVVNRFQEVFADSKLSFQTRLRNISELFHSDSCVCSLKDSNKCYINGKTDIVKSFEATKAATVQVSKRIYIEHPDVQEYPVTFCLDLHRVELAPGLGDPSKENALLYQCEGPQIKGIWGMTDINHLSNDTELTAEAVYENIVWKKASEIIASKWFGNVDTSSLKIVQSCAHYHNYDHMEVWG